MWGGSLPAELRDSVRLVGAERRVLAGGLLAVVVYGGWVLGTGTLADAVAPSLAGSVLFSVDSVPVDGLVVFAAVGWILVPAIVAAALLDRALKNTRGNLASRYRFDHPSALVAPSGLVVLALVAASAATGPSPLLVAAGAVAAAHLFVRTLAYGYRVYTFSVPPLLALLSVIAAASLAVGWLVHAPALGALSVVLGDRLAAAGVASVAQTIVAASGADAGTVRSVAVMGPAVLAAAYLVPQSVAGLVVALRAPLENPQPRPGQRYPSVGRRTAAPSAAAARPAQDDGVAETDADEAALAETEPSDETDEAPADADESGGTRVFTPDQPLPDETAAAENETTASDGTTADEWFADTAVYTDDGAGGGTSDRCPACHVDVPADGSARFCPNCGERLD
ncbi:zinc ribbon domain-containing protein [Halomicroarcula sp. GCM10025817]|uniref:zinc ribbon domain-containing protein n=1 Tax=Haloarcula TaxID=2237 RepID=UPI0023E8497C|nr:zinc ribbon domain-containing protein [Halomicroarcula sp. SYNS111]